MTMPSRDTVVLREDGQLVGPAPTWTAARKSPTRPLIWVRVGPQAKRGRPVPFIPQWGVDAIPQYEKTD